VNIELCFITYFSSKVGFFVFVVVMSEAVEQLKRKVAGLTKESEELQRFKRAIDWLKTLEKRLVRDGFD